MNTHETELRRYESALVLDEYISRDTRHAVRVFLLAVLITSGLAFLVFYYGRTLIEDARFSQSTFVDPLIYGGVFFITLAFLVALYLFSFFYNTLYYRGINSIVGERFSDTRGITYEVASVMKRNRTDVTEAFLMSAYGMQVMLRVNIPQNEVKRFLAHGEREAIPMESVPLPQRGFLTLEDLGRFLYAHDTAFNTFITKHGRPEDSFFGSLRWVSRSRISAKYRSKWWSRDNLGRIRGIGRELSFGVAYELQQFTRPLGSSAVFSAFSKSSGYAAEVIEQMETALGRSKAANVILVGEPGVGKIDLCIELARRMFLGKSAEAVTGKRLILFDHDMFIAQHNSKEAFELNFLALFLQAERAGNIIVVIDNITGFLQSARSLGVDTGELLDRFLASPNLQLIATVEPGAYHDSVEGEGLFLSRFESIMVENPSLESTVRVLEGVAEREEAGGDLFFTYPGVVAVAESADRYITNGVMPDKAVGLLSDISGRARQKRQTRIDRNFVEACVSEKTGIPLGPVKGKEKEKLLNLENRLHERVVGQHSAITAIARAMRRARAGVQSKDRPLGSFLFLGSTGVGKTETAKALAHVFFGDEEHMSRLDMSEYSGADALTQLIGDGTEAGALASLLREHPYGVVLLDEFEKTSSKVHDLFLQVLDEGVFTDGRGTQVNARNAIIIATSNAGSDLIWEMTGRGEDPSEKKDEIIDHVIGENIFKPELINRFDATIAFKTLQEDDLHAIAKLMLRDFRKRMEKKGYAFVITDELISMLAEKGHSPEFGARPMRRVLQDEIEEAVAQKIIAGDLKEGGVIQLSEKDFN